MGLLWWGGALDRYACIPLCHRTPFGFLCVSLSKYWSLYWFYWNWHIRWPPSPNVTNDWRPRCVWHSRNESNKHSINIFFKSVLPQRLVDMITSSANIFVIKTRREETHHILNWQEVTFAEYFFSIFGLQKKGLCTTHVCVRKWFLIWNAQNPINGMTARGTTFWLMDWGSSIFTHWCYKR